MWYVCEISENLNKFCIYMRRANDVKESLNIMDDWIHRSMADHGLTTGGHLDGDLWRRKVSFSFGWKDHCDGNFLYHKHSIEELKLIYLKEEFLPEPGFIPQVSSSLPLSYSNKPIQIPLCISPGRVNKVTTFIWTTCSDFIKSERFESGLWYVTE